MGNERHENGLKSLSLPLNILLCFLSSESSTSSLNFHGSAKIVPQLCEIS